MAGVYSQQGCELILAVELLTRETVEKALDRLDMTPETRKDIAAGAAKYIADELATTWGGQQVYIPMDLARRNAAIFKAFNGDNHHELARKFRTSTNHIYNIIKAERDRRRHRQLKLLP